MLQSIDESLESGRSRRCWQLWGRMHAWRRFVWTARQVLSRQIAFMSEALANAPGVLHSPAHHNLSVHTFSQQPCRHPLSQIERIESRGHLAGDSAQVRKFVSAAQAPASTPRRSAAYPCPGPPCSSSCCWACGSRKCRRSRKFVASLPHVRVRMPA